MDHITEWKLETTTKDIYIYMYYYKNNEGVCLGMVELYKISKKIKEVNNICGDLLCSWVDINIDDVYIKNKNENNNIVKEHFKLIKKVMPVNNNDEKHRIILKGLILRSIKYILITNSLWNYLGNNTYIKKDSISKQNLVEIYEKIKYDCNINLNGNIFIGFNLSYQIISQENLKDYIIKGHKIKKGDFFIYKQNGQRIEYIKDHNKKLKDYIINKEANETLYKYLDKKGFVKIYKINSDSIPILGLSIDINNRFKKNKLTYAPEMLYIIKSDYRLSYSFNVGGNNIQIKNSIEYTRDVVNNLEKKFIKKKLISPDFNNLSIRYHDLEKFNYEIVKYNIDGIIKDKKTSQFKKEIDISKLCILIICDDKFKKHTASFLEYMKNYLIQNLRFQKSKINIEFTFIEKKEDINDKNYDSAIVILQNKKDLNYNIFKEFLNKREIPNQMISQITFQKFDNIKKDKWEKYNKDNLISNLCLGILYKMNIHPWELSSTTKSDCFISFDVSHEDGKHFSGCVALLKNSNGSFDNIFFGQKERGEIISAKTLKLFLNKALDKYKEINKKLPEHITIHRDGFIRESEISTIKKVLNMKKNKNINYTMLSIIKKINRKLFTFENNNIISPPKVAYINRTDNTALLILTDIKFDIYNPTKNNKLACPIKIEFKYNHSNLKIEDIINDIYKLSCLRYHTTNNTKLPLTIEYADKHSTSFNRNILENNKDYFINYMP